MSAYPHRLRHYRTRTVHAAEAVNLATGRTILITAHGDHEGPRDERMPDTATVTCTSDACQLAVLPPLGAATRQPAR
ncbi:hypothetical protein [Kitasatospora sp. NPDC018619]|uniref:hypothetical protein n=1 Tax=unclassified Kitasatospora TaxID=2633591 RepID=UPI00378D85C6